VLFALLCYPFFIDIDTLKYPDSTPLNFPVFMFAVVVLLVYGTLLYFITNPKYTVYLKYAFCLVLMTELVYFSSTTMNSMEASETSEFQPKTGYNDYTFDALDYIKKTDRSFFRLDKSYFSSPAKYISHNDGMIQGYRSTRSYSPFNQLHYILYLQLMGILKEDVENESRWVMGLNTRPVLGAENQVKYYLAKTNVNPFWKIICEQLPPFGNVTAFRSNYVLPFGYTYDHYISEATFSGLSVVQKDFVSLRACVLDDYEMGKPHGLKPFLLRDTMPAASYSPVLFKQWGDELGREALGISHFNETSLTGSIDVSEDKIVYLSVPYDDGWELKVDGQPQEKAIVAAGMTGVLLKKGKHTIEMDYDLRYFTIGVMLSVAGLLAYAALWFYARAKKNRAEASLSS
jgi:uncharacterized membrane protein YfhO